MRVVFFFRRKYGGGLAKIEINRRADDPYRDAASRAAGALGLSARGELGRRPDRLRFYRMERIACKGLLVYNGDLVLVRSAADFKHYEHYVLSVGDYDDAEDDALVKDTGVENGPISTYLSTDIVANHVLPYLRLKADVTRNLRLVSKWFRDCCDRDARLFPNVLLVTSFKVPTLTKLSTDVVANGVLPYLDFEADVNRNLRRASRWLLHCCDLDARWLPIVAPPFLRDEDLNLHEHGFLLRPMYREYQLWIKKISRHTATSMEWYYHLAPWRRDMSYPTPWLHKMLYGCSRCPRSRFSNRSIGYWVFSPESGRYAGEISTIPVRPNMVTDRNGSARYFEIVINAVNIREDNPVNTSVLRSWIEPLEQLLQCYGNFRVLVNDGTVPVLDNNARQATRLVVDVMHPLIGGSIYNHGTVTWSLSTDWISSRFSSPGMQLHMYLNLMLSLLAQIIGGLEECANRFCVLNVSENKAWTTRSSAEDVTQRLDTIHARRDPHLLFCPQCFLKLQLAGFLHDDISGVLHRLYVFLNQFQYVGFFRKTELHRLRNYGAEYENN